MMNSTNSVGSSGGSEGTGWGTMGGGAGDGIQQQQGQQPPASFSTPQQQQQQQQPPYLNTNMPPSGGSITRFATPDMQQQQQQPQQTMSFAARSQQAYAGGGATAATPGSSSYAARSQQAYGIGGPAAGSSYATRSQQAYQTQQPPVPASNSTNTPSVSYTARSQQQQSYGSQQPQQQPQQQPTTSHSSYGSPAPQQQQSNVYTGAGGGAGMYYPQQQQQQQAQQPSPQQRSQSGGGFNPQQHQQQQQQQPSQSGVYSNQQQPMQSPPPPPQQPYGNQAAPSSSAGSYAQRSAATLYGQQQQPQQQGTAGSGVVPHQHQHHQPQQQQEAYHPTGAPPMVGPESTQQQQKLLTEATRKVQEHSYYMKQAMDQHSLPVVLDRASHMVGELGGPPHGHQQHNPGFPVNTGGSAKLTPKNYYELYMRALEDMPAVEEYLLHLAVQPSDEQQNSGGGGMIRIVDPVMQQQQRRTMTSYTMRQLYDCVQYCPRVVSRLYLQIATGSALIRSGECQALWVMRDLQQAIKCEQNPVRGLFLRYFLLTALRDKLPDTPVPHKGAPKLATIPSEGDESKEDGDNGGDGKMDVNDDDSAADYDEQHTSRRDVDVQDKGSVKDSYEFILANFMEMNKLWVRIQHLPGEGKNKDVRKRRERERNDLRILVGTNLVRLSQLECVTSKIYGEFILPQILEHIVTTGDPLSQAYLMDCLVQVFPDEYHIETLPILLNVCPRLRDKVNIRTILQGLMDRLANYLAEEELLDESDTNQVKKTLARDSFGLFEECVQKVYNARGPKLTSKEVIRLQTALLQFSIKCYPGHMEQIGRCINSCVDALRQANASYEALPDGTMANAPAQIKALDDASVVELEKMLSIPLDSLALRVFELEQYSGLIGFLPWVNRREVAISMLKSVENAGSTPSNLKEIEQLFNVIEPLIRDQSAPIMPGYGQSPYIDPRKVQEENSHVAKLVHLLDHKNTDVLFEMLRVARDHICRDRSGPHRIGKTLVAVIFASLRLAKRIFDAEEGVPEKSLLQKDTSELKSSTESVKVSDATDKPSEGEQMDTSIIEQKVDSIALDNGEGDETKAPEAETKNAPGTESKEAAPETETTTTPEVETKNTSDAEDTESIFPPLDKSTSCRAIFVFIQETLATLSKNDSETAFKLFMEVSLSADTLAVAEKRSENGTGYTSIAYELLTQAFALYEEHISDGKAQYRCINVLSGTLLALQSMGKEDYESLITKTAQFAAKVLKKADQCQLVALCAHLFYPIKTGGPEPVYSNPQRALECLQRSLKLADACTSMNSAHVTLFVDLLEHYLYFFEKKNPLITDGYISGLVALVKEHLSNTVGGGDGGAKAHYIEVVQYIRQKKSSPESAERFAPIQIGE